MNNTDQQKLRIFDAERLNPVKQNAQRNLENTHSDILGENKTLPNTTIPHSTANSLQQSSVQRIQRQQGNRLVQRLVNTRPNNQSTSGIVQREGGATKAGSGASPIPVDLSTTGRRRLSTGEKVISLSADYEHILDRVKIMFEQWRQNRPFFSPVDWSTHPLRNKLAGAFSGNTFHNNPIWSSGMLDNGKDDTATLGLRDFDIQVDLALYVDQVETAQSGEGKYTTGGETKSTETNSSEIGATVGVEGGKEGGKASGGFEAKEGTEKSVEETGKGEWELSLSYAVCKAECFVEVRVMVDHTAYPLSAIADPSLVKVGTVLFTSPVVPPAASGPKTKRR